MKCFNCDNCLTKTHQKKFCSQSCAASFNNRKYPKKSIGYRSCRGCKKQYPKKELPVNCYCVECKLKTKDNLLYNRNPTKKEITYEKHKHGAAFAYIRWHARKVVMKDKELKCQVCNYTNHVEVAHKKSISSFSEDTKLSEINDLENLLLLCPNHHWEFDHKKREKVDLVGIEPTLGIIPTD